MDFMEGTKDYAVTILGLTALEMPTMISIAPKDSILSTLQSLGFPFNMSSEFMRDHIAFSPRNIMAGRYYTVFTNVYYHTDQQHMLQNMVVLTACGISVHKNVGRRHFLSIFTGGGFFGNLGMWFYYLMQRYYLGIGQEVTQQLPSLAQKEVLHGTKEITDLKEIMTVEILNRISCQGSSAGVNAVLSFGACCSLERVFRKLKECQIMHQGRDIYFLADVFNILFTLRLFSNDLGFMMETFLMENGMFDQLRNATTRNATGYGAHVAGTLFGIAYYFMYRKE